MAENVQGREVVEGRNHFCNKDFFLVKILDTAKLLQARRKHPFPLLFNLHPTVYLAHVFREDASEFSSRKNVSVSEPDAVHILFGRFPTRISSLMLPIDAQGHPTVFSKDEHLELFNGELVPMFPHQRFSVVGRLKLGKERAEGLPTDVSAILHDNPGRLIQIGRAHV